MWRDSDIVDSAETGPGPKQIFWLFIYCKILRKLQNCYYMYTYFTALCIGMFVFKVYLSLYSHMYVALSILHLWMMFRFYSHWNNLFPHIHCAVIFYKSTWGLNLGCLGLKTWTGWTRLQHWQTSHSSHNAFPWLPFLCLCWLTTRTAKPPRHSHERAIGVCPWSRLPFSGSLDVHQTPSCSLIPFRRPKFSQILDF